MSRRVMEDIFFWLGRYTERVDYHARLIDANFQEYQESSGFEADRLPLWQRLMEMLGELQSYQTGHPEPGEKSILFFLTLDPDHANSIASCLNLARNNARAVRERIPGFVWEAINETYLWLRDKNISAIFEASPYLFYQHIKERIALFYGIADSSMLRRHEWHILQCGRYMERAENTVRILQMLVKCSEVCRDQVSPEQYQQLLTLLKDRGWGRGVSPVLCIRADCGKCLPFSFAQFGIPALCILRVAGAGPQPEAYAASGG